MAGASKIFEFYVKIYVDLWLISNETVSTFQRYERYETLTIVSIVVRSLFGLLMYPENTDFSNNNFMEK